MSSNGAGPTRSAWFGASSTGTAVGFAPRRAGYRMRNGDEVDVSETESTDFGVETIEDDDRVAVIAVHGQADLHTAPELRTAIAGAIDGGANGVVVDLSEATFVDSMTLGVLLGAVKRLRPSGGKVTIVCVDPHVRRIFEITLLDRVFSIHADRDDARDVASGVA
jgi:anti-sigma B factor antagonist